MSVEIRSVCDRPADCTSHKVLPIGSDRCVHHLECDWGRINNGAADPRRNIEHLVVVPREMVTELASGVGYLDWRGSTGRVVVDGDRLFFHLDFDGKHWTWELFEAHWWDHKRPEIYVGRWPD